MMGLTSAWFVPNLSGTTVPLAGIIMNCIFKSLWYLIVRIVASNFKKSDTWKVIWLLFIKSLRKCWELALFQNTIRFIEICHVSFVWNKRICNWLYSLRRYPILGPLAMGITSLDSGEWKCLVCQKNFKYQKSARRHFIEIHNQDASQVAHCDYCGRNFVNDRYLKNHLNSVHQITQKMLHRSYIPK